MTEIFITVAATVGTASFIYVFGEMTLAMIGSAVLSKIAKANVATGLQSIASKGSTLLGENKAVIFVTGKLQDAALSGIKSGALQAFAASATALNPSSGVQAGFNAGDASDVETQMKKAIHSLVRHAKVSLRNFADSQSGRTPKAQKMSEADIQAALEIMWRANIMFPPPDIPQPIDPILQGRIELAIWLAEIASTGRYVETSEYVTTGYGVPNFTSKSTPITSESFPNGLPPVSHETTNWMGTYHSPSKEIYIKEVGGNARDRILTLWNNPEILKGVPPLTSGDFRNDRGEGILHKIEKAMTILPTLTKMEPAGGHVSCNPLIKPL